MEQVNPIRGTAEQLCNDYEVGAAFVVAVTAVNGQLTIASDSFGRPDLAKLIVSALPQLTGILDRATESPGRGSYTETQVLRKQGVG